MFNYSTLGIQQSFSARKKRQ